MRNSFWGWAQIELVQNRQCDHIVAATLWDFKRLGSGIWPVTGFRSLCSTAGLANQVNRLILNMTGDQLESNPGADSGAGITVNGQAPGNLIDFQLRWRLPASTAGRRF